MRIKFLDAIASEYKKSLEENRFLIFVVPRLFRQPLAFFLAKEIPPRNFAVLATEEIPRGLATVVSSIVSFSTREEQVQEDT